MDRNQSEDDAMSTFFCVAVALFIARIALYTYCLVKAPRSVQRQGTVITGENP